MDRYRQRLEKVLAYYRDKGLEETALLELLIERGGPPQRTYPLGIKRGGWPVRVHVYVLEDREIHVAPAGFAVKERKLS